METLTNMVKSGLPPREEILALLHEHTETPGLRKHALAVEAAMRAYARTLGEDPELWGATGLIHDFDYEKHPTPEEHPRFGCAILGERGYPPALIEAVMGHAAYTNTQRESPLAKALFACDELFGMITATAPVQPRETPAEGTPPSAAPQMKTRSFPRPV